ncbi:7,8-dihydro-6-hydroxymethylpterin-pyrophosphokinase [Sphingomonas sp. Leaf412]|uniref:2-amino-4-hydroxy-6- hydroxymethyldihydropteridine diphosphokinase n=1 Tax=Sphingomonas sp. Leaf412 TaxID=1736370 RepID=UPI0006F2DBA1|nr:2-amino-4-hydroxy-6-hydroxymethyldihydropteridine diphosphokinase [Sphingomonas sp. Leaf412]KQT35420.1 7,8-dihydro-6-hydroxymethylpterin-pyrophosphokinase [Sphingomonas sp. Leaf412]
MRTSTYVVAVGSNRRGRHGGPRAEVAAALDRLGGLASRIVASAPIGPSTRTFANAVALVRTDREPEAMLAWLKDIERDFGRRRGRRWGERVIDLDIVLWSGGMWASPGLVVPHVAFRTRAFVLALLAELAPSWRDPVTGRRVRHLLAQETRRRRLPLHVGP